VLARLLWPLRAWGDILLADCGFCSYLDLHALPQRSSVELHLREIKTLLVMDVLRCQSPKMIEKELAMHRIACNLVRALMQRAAICHHVRLERLSFKGTLDSLEYFANAIHACTGKPPRQARMIEQLLAAIAFDPLPHRVHRSEPRARKRRQKTISC
jgi:hypothetical protein